MNRRQFLTRAATTVAVSAVAVTPMVGSVPCPLADLERQWLRFAQAEADHNHKADTLLNGRSVFKMSPDEIMELDRAVGPSPCADMKRIAAEMAATPAKDHTGVSAKMRVALGKGRVGLGKKFTHIVGADLVESALADMARLTA